MTDSPSRIRHTSNVGLIPMQSSPLPSEITKTVNQPPGSITDRAAAITVVLGEF